MVNNAKHKFKTNLLKASCSPDFEVAKTEWAKIDEEHDLDDCDSQLCICQRKVKHIIYMYNKTTNKSIFVGTKCYNKFKLKSHKMKDEIYRNILLDAIRKGEYEVIDDIVIYSEYVMNRHIEYYRNIIDMNKHNLIELLSIRKKLITAVDVPYLQPELTRLETLIKSLYTNKIKNEKSIKRLRNLRLLFNKDNYLDDLLPFLSKRIDDIEKWISKNSYKEHDDYVKSRLLAIGVSEEIYNDHKDIEKNNVDNIDYIDFLRDIKSSEHSENYLNRIIKRLLLYYNIKQPAVKGLLSKIDFHLKNIRLLKR